MQHFVMIRPLGNILVIFITLLSIQFKYCMIEQTDCRNNEVLHHFNKTKQNAKITFACEESSA